MVIILPGSNPEDRRGTVRNGMILDQPTSGNRIAELVKSSSDSEEEAATRRRTPSDDHVGSLVILTL
jgi:hypothetical protein